VPAGSVEVVMTKGGALMVNYSGAVLEIETASVTRTVKLLEPAASGVPEIAPLAVRLRPEGREPAAIDHV